ncbi:hemK methyltransferase family member 1 isoform X1 [Octopus vulgaris]|uniref:peptide chain release factor N(5)-glutamine methyltransferase n=1 Tax=Octopus vulgaris TaxID=6645 RepID=A0AA36AV04_OCTVU|nr:hemK methyltransferase family member 1 isoform X1 [Octopus vulgaris]
MFRALYRISRTNLSFISSVSESPVRHSSVAPCWYLKHSANRPSSSSSAANVPAVTVGELCNNWTIKMSLSGIPEAKQSAELIIANVLHLPTLHNVLSSVTLTPDQVTQVKLNCEKRMHRIPLQYIIGEWDFCDLTLKMQPPVFIPRPETEQLVGHILSFLDAEKKETKGRFLEIGCGSGSLSLALLHKLTQWNCVATDISKESRYLTHENAHRCKLADRIQIIEHDINKGAERLKEFSPFDFLVSNPPYINDKDMKTLLPEVKFYEDQRALRGGKDGLDLIKAVLKTACHLVSPSGSIWLEVDCSHISELYKWVVSETKLCLRTVNILPDYSGRDRFFHFMRTEDDSGPD